MDLKQLRSFVAIAEAGSISKASHVVNTVQPALSSHLRTLEDDLGVQLFIRTGRGVELSEAGERLLSHVKYILHRIDLARDEMKTVSDDVSGAVSIGCLHGLAEVIAPGYVPALKETYPGVNPSFITYSSNELQKSMIESELDMYITFSTVEAEDTSAKQKHIEEQLHPGIAEIQEFAREEMFVCTRAHDHKSAKRGVTFSDTAIDLDEVCQSPIAVPPRDQAVYRMIRWLSSRAGVDLNIYASTNSMRTIIDWVVAGKCIALLPETSLKRAFSSEPLIAMPISGLVVTRGLVFCTSPNVEKRSVRAVTREFTIEFLKSLDF